MPRTRPVGAQTDPLQARCGAFAGPGTCYHYPRLVRQRVLPDAAPTGGADSLSTRQAVDKGMSRASVGAAASRPRSSRRLADFFLATRSTDQKPQRQRPTRRAGDSDNLCVKAGPTTRTPIPAPVIRQSHAELPNLPEDHFQANPDKQTAAGLVYNNGSDRRIAKCAQA